MLRKERHDGQKDWEAANKSKLSGLFQYLKVTDRRLLIPAKNTGAWMSVCGTTVSGIVLSAAEVRDIFCAGYKISPLNFQSHCNICGTAFGVMYTLSCSTGILVITRHNEIRDELLYISQRVFTLSSVCAKPLIHQGRTRSEQEIRQDSETEK